MQESSSYAFNQSHAQAYAILSSWEAWYKYHHPQEFLTALMQTDPTEVPRYVREARRRGYTVLPPDINESGSTFTLSEKVIRYGLEAIASVSDTSIVEICPTDRSRAFKTISTRRRAEERG